MSIHDWTRVRDNRFHDFHQSWTVALAGALNGGRLPPGYFAMLERKATTPIPDIVTLDLPSSQQVDEEIARLRTVPPKARIVQRTQVSSYARKANRVTIRHPDGGVVAVIEVVSPGNKESRHALQDFARKAVAYLHAGIHLLIVDLFPPSKRDPQGIHKVIWDRLGGDPLTPPADKPLTLAAYAAGPEIVAYVEPVAVGDALPDMPVFLVAEGHVLCPLEATYQTAWAQFPQPLKGPLESPAP